MVEITFYGGVSEIGGNKFFIQEADTQIFLDFGMNFAKEADYFEFPLLRPACKEDLFKLNLLPKIKGLYKNQNLCAEYTPDGSFKVVGTPESKEIDAIFLSHAHMDHYGYFGMVREDIPIYMSEITKKFIELRNRVGTRSWNLDVEDHDFKALKKDNTLQVNNLSVKRYDVDHSLLGASGYIINTNNKTIAYTGDFRFHGHRGDLTEEFLSALKNEHIDILITEGTRVPKPKKGIDRVLESHILSSEQQVYDRCFDIISKAEGLVIYDASPADLDRVLTIWKVAQKTGRTLVIDSKKAYLILYMNAENLLVDDLPNIDDFLIYLNRQKFRRGKDYNACSGGIEVYAETFAFYRMKHEAELTIKQQIESPRKKPRTLHEYKKYYRNDHLFEIEADRFIWGPLGRNKILNNGNEYLIYTSNGMQTMLQFKPENIGINGTYIYGKAEPFNEEMRLSFKRLNNWLNICDLKIEYAHTSGHINNEEMENFLKEVKPDKLIPIHTLDPQAFYEISWGSVKDVVIPSYGIPLKF